MYLSVIIPAYNEEGRLGRTLASVTDFLDQQNYKSEIIVVNDGSTDKTLELVNSFLVKIPRLRILNNPTNSGKGYSVKQGMLEAYGEFRLFMDSDGSTPIEQVRELLPYFDKGYSVVIGSRRIDGAKIESEQPWYRLALGRIFRGLVDTILPLGVIDSQNGFKMFTARAVEEIFPLQTIDRWAFDVELLFLANKHGFKIKEVPIVWKNDSQSKVTFKGMVEMLQEIMKIRIRNYR